MDDSNTTYLPYRWFERATYPRAVELMVDSEYWPKDYDTWHGLAKDAMTRLSRNGVVALRQTIDPERFANWCHDHDRHTDSDSRLTYAAIEFRLSAGVRQL